MNEEKKIRVISFTKQGSRLNREIGKKLTEIGYRCSCYTVERFADKNERELCLAPLPEKEKRSAWIGQYWGKEAFLFIGASGIAVRLIAPWVKDKFTDSPVLVMDERAEYVIPAVVGACGRSRGDRPGDRRICGSKTGDHNGYGCGTGFAVDVFAADNRLRIGNRTTAKQISAALLDGKCVGFYAEYPWQGTFPDRLRLCGSKSELEAFAKRQGFGIWVSGKKEACLAGILQLIPQNLAVGIGCRRGTEEAAIESGLREILEEHGCRMEQITAIASIHLKQDEPGLIGLAEKLHVPFRCYSAEELMKAGRWKNPRNLYGR